MKEPTEQTKKILSCIVDGYFGRDTETATTTIIEGPYFDDRDPREILSDDALKTLGLTRKQKYE